MEHCCERMKFAVEPRENSISPWLYDKADRAYRVQSVNHLGAGLVDYCPYCGTKFPKPLCEEWERTLRKDYKFKDPFKASRENRIPAEFKTDEWWKKRGL